MRIFKGVGRIDRKKVDIEEKMIYII